MSTDKKSIFIDFAHQQLIFDASGALFWPTKKTLVVADLHLEKGSYYARRGSPLPLYDTIDTLQRLEQLIIAYQPETLISLGDNIHDIQAFIRMHPEHQLRLSQLTPSLKQWIWLNGNHDRHTLPAPLPNLYCYSQFCMDSITFIHDFVTNIPFQISGHYHPKVCINTIRGKCFLLGKDKIIMPSFGSYTGGLDIDSTDFKNHLPKEHFKVFLLNRGKIWRVR